MNFAAAAAFLIKASPASPSKAALAAPNSKSALVKITSARGPRGFAAVFFASGRGASPDREASAENSILTDSDI